MNNYIYPLPNNYQQIILSELKRINDTLEKIERIINKKDNKDEKNYLEKDDNYYMI